jgi:hypothetical protein
LAIKSLHKGEPNAEDSNNGQDLEDEDDECANCGLIECSCAKQGGDNDNEDDDDDEDDFECDIERYVPFEEKLEFAEKLKSCSQELSKECLTEIIKTIQDTCPQAVEDFRNSRIQLKIDMIERDAYLKSLEIMEKYQRRGPAPNRPATDDDAQDHYLPSADALIHTSQGCQSMQ